MISRDNLGHMYEYLFGSREIYVKSFEEISVPEIVKGRILEFAVTFNIIRHSDLAPEVRNFFDSRGNVVSYGGKVYEEDLTIPKREGRLFRYYRDVSSVIHEVVERAKVQEIFSILRGSRSKRIKTKDLAYLPEIREIFSVFDYDDLSLGFSSGRPGEDSSLYCELFLHGGQKIKPQDLAGIHHPLGKLNYLQKGRRTSNRYRYWETCIRPGHMSRTSTK